MVKRSRIWLFVKRRGLPEPICTFFIFSTLCCLFFHLCSPGDGWKFPLITGLGMFLIFSVFSLLLDLKYVLDIIINKPVWIEGKIIEKSDILVYVPRTLRTVKVGEKLSIEDFEGRTVKIDLSDKVLEEINTNALLKKRLQYKKRYHYLPLSKFVIDIEFIPVIRDNHYKLMKDKKYRREIKTWIEAPEYRE